MKTMRKRKNDWLIAIVNHDSVKTISQELYESLGIRIFSVRPLNIEKPTLLVFHGEEKQITRIGMLLIGLRASIPDLEIELIDREGLI